MHTLLKAVFAGTRRAARTALPLLGYVTIAGTVSAQQPVPPFGQPQPTPPAQPPFGPQPAPGAQPGGFGQQPQPGGFGQQPQPGGFGQPQPGGFGQPQPGGFGQPQPGGFGQQPQPGGFGQPQPGGFGQPQPGGFGQPQPGGFGQPQPGGFGQPQPGGQQGGAGVSFGADASFGGEGLDANADAAASTGADADWEEEERARSLINQPNLWGSTGLMRTSYAGSGAPGTFRVGFTMDWFSTSGFLCDPAASTAAGEPIVCGPDAREDSASHVGGFFTVNATPFSFLEGYASLRTYANYNDQGRPSLLQVLGDTTFGVKLFTPNKIGKTFTFGGELQLMLLNGTGDVGVAGGGTSAAFRGLASMDLRKPQGKGFPLRTNLNLGYKLDNSGVLVKEIEQGRAEAFTDDRDRQPISRIERFGLGINKVDFFQIGLGFELPLRVVQPYLEYSIDIPVNRQGYECHTGRVSRGDVCLGLDDFSANDPVSQGGPGYAGVPSRLSLGLRATPFSKAFRGLSAHVGFDIGLSATSTFIEEVAPQAPWTLYVGLGYAYDTKEKEPPPPVVQPAPPAPPPQIIPAPQNFIRGFVHEQGKPDVAIANAIINIEGGGQPPVATGPDGRFMSRHLEPGSYTFSISAPGYKPGTCQGTIVAGNPLGSPGAPGQQQPSPFGQPQQGGFGQQPSPFGQPQQGGFGQPQQGGFGQQPSPFGQPQQGGFGQQPAPFGQPQPGQPGQQPAPFGQPQPGQPGSGTPGQSLPQGPTYVDIDCAVEAEPRLGNLVGTVKDTDTGEAVAGATVRLTDANGAEQTATSDPSGNFRFKDLQPGQVALKVEAQGYMNHVNQADIRASEDVRAALNVNKRPKIALVKILGNEVRITKQINFENDSAKILGDSNALLEEIADVLQRNPNIRKVEIQGHTDNTGGREHNQRLSESRANAVRAWLVKAGVDGNRLLAKGYGQDRPLAPNVTTLNKAKNRRVQFIILEKN